MAFYVYAWRDVRNAGDSTGVAGTKDVPRVESTIRKFVVEKATDPTATDLLIPIKDTFGEITVAQQVALAADCVDASAAADRADDSVTVPAFRWGKSFLQFGIGYHSLNPIGATANINWKDLA